MLIRVLAGWAAVATALTGATQLRASGFPIGVGEVLLALWMAFLAFCLLRGVRFAYSDAFRIISVYWGVSAVLLGFGTIMALLLGKFDFLKAQHDAPAFLFVACVACLFAVRVGDAGDEYHLKVAKTLFFTISATSGLLVGLALVTSALGPIELWYAERRFQGWAENPNQPALFVAAMPFLGWYLLRQAQGFGRKLAYAAAIACCLAAGVATHSDALFVGWAASLAGVLLWAWIRTALRAQGHVLYISHVVVPILALVLVVAFGSEIVERVEQISESIYEQRGQGDKRIRLWLNGIDAILHSPLTGLGPGAYSGDFQAFSSREAHNSLIDWGMSTGLLGVALHIGLWLLCLWRALRSGTPAIAGMVTSLSFFSLFHYAFRHPVYWLLLVLVLAFTERRAFALAPNEPVRWEERRVTPAFLAPSRNASSS